MNARHVTDAGAGLEPGIAAMLERTLVTLDELPESAGKHAMSLEAQMYKHLLDSGAWTRPESGQAALLLQNVRELYAATITALARARAEKADSSPRRRARHLAPAE